MDLFSVKILHLSEVTIEMKEFLIYKLNKTYQLSTCFNPVIYKLEHNGGLMSPQAKLNYKGGLDCHSCFIFFRVKKG